MSGTPSQFWSAHGLEIHVTGPGFGADGQTFHIERPFARVGRASNCDLQLDHDDVSRWHLYLHRHEDGLYFIDLGSRLGSMVDGQAQPRGWLFQGQIVKVGPFELQIAGIEGAPAYDPCRKDDRPETLADRHILRLTGRTGAIVDQELDRPLTILGRDAPSRLVLPDESIARTHVLFYQHAGKLWIINLAGLQAFRNDYKIDAELLEPDARLRLGKYYIVDVVRPGKAEAIEADQELESQLEQARLRIQELEAEASAERRRLQDEVERLHKELEEASAAAHEQQEVVAKFNERVSLLSGEIKQAGDKFAAGEAELKAAVERAAAAEQQNLQLSETLDELTRQLEESRTESAKSQDDVAALRESLEQASQRIVELEQQPGIDQQTQSEIESLRSQIEQWTQANEQLQQQLEEAKQSAAEREQKSLDLESQVASLSGRLDETNAKLADADQRAEESVRELEAVRSELETLRAQAAEYQERTAEFDRLSDQLQQAANTESELRAALTDAESKTSNLQQQLAQWIREKEELESRLAELESASAQGVVSELAGANFVDDDEQETMLLPDGHVSRMAELDRELAAARQMVLDLETDQQSTGERLAELSEENQKLRRRISTLDEEQKSYTQRAAEQQQQLDALRQELEQAKAAAQEWEPVRTRLVGELEQATQALQNAQLALAERTQELELLKSSSAEAGQWRQSYYTLTAHFEEMNESLRQDLQKERDAAQSLSQEVDALAQEYAELRRQREACLQQIEDADARLDAFLDQVASSSAPQPAAPAAANEASLDWESEKSALVAELQKFRELLASKQAECEQLKAQLERMTGQFVADDYFSYLSRRRESR